MVSSGRAAPPFVRMAAHPLRWRLLTELAGGDHRVRELTELLGESQNLVSYHLRLLRDGGLVTARRSSFDARDSYYHLDLDRCAKALTTTGAGLHPVLGLSPPPPPTLPGDGSERLRVLFACTGNSSRSPIAEALLRHRAGDHVDVTSAGSRPKPRLHPDAIRVLREEFGVDLHDRRPRHLDTLAGRRFDHVITVCDKVREVCPGFGGDSRPVHWSLPDPAAAEDTYPAFVRVAREIDTRIGHLLSVFATTAHPDVRP
jgi:protein-tyrosine-phosphatase/DNA-binding transcriptional ArsR family regulator